MLSRDNYLKYYISRHNLLIVKADKTAID